MKANVLFFDCKEASEDSWTKKLWIDDLRPNQHFTLNTNPLKESDLEDFVKNYGGPPSKSNRKEIERLKKFTHDEIVARDIFRLKGESLEDPENLPPPGELAAKIVESLEVALEEFRAVEESLLSPQS